MILAPTRELGQQIAEQIALFAGRMKGIRTVAVYGGANIVTQINQLKRPCQVVIATPGRLIDLAKRKAVKLDQIKFLVLDEADEMLNMGFKEELDTILSFTPDEKEDVAVLCHHAQGDPAHGQGLHGGPLRGPRRSQDNASTPTLTTSMP